MKTVIDISDELKNIGSVLADMSHKMPYSVPEGYFDNFEKSLRNTITDLNTQDEVQGWGKQMPFSMPSGYFESLAGQVLAEAKIGDLVASIPKTMPSEVPSGYFESFPAVVLAVAQSAEKVPVRARKISFFPATLYRQLVWTAAAVFLLAVGVGSYVVLSKSTINPEKILASVPNTDIQDYVQHTYRLDVDRIVSNVGINDLPLDNKDIEQYLDETGWDIVD
jgi:hypothetical protein